MNDKQLTIWIDGRVALPVRAIPYVADWENLLSPDVVAKSFEHGKDWYSARCANLTAYHLQRNEPIKVERREWKKVTVQIEAFEAELFQKYGEEGLAGKIGYAVWQRESASKLPAGVFVWLDEFEKEYQAECEREGRVSKQFVDAKLILTPMAADADTRAMVMAGFEEFQNVTGHKPDDNKTLNTSNGKHLLEARIQGYVEERRIREAAQPERMKLLASKKQLGLGDWIEITHIGVADEKHYTATAKGIRFNGWGEEIISSRPTDEEADMRQQNEERGLAFPCTPKELIEFVDSGAGRLYGSFLVPDEFRNAVIQIEQAHTPPENAVNNEEYVSWYDAQMDAATWWSLKSVTPIEAAQLMCQFNPHDNNDYPTTITNDETAPDDYKRLLRIFEDEEKADAKARNLSRWRDIARDKKLKYHSWIDKYAQAMKLLAPAEPEVQFASAVMMGAVADITPASVKQANKLRTNTLDPVIDKAIEQAGCTTLAHVYLKLKEMALSSEIPFTGVIDGDALCYTNDNDEPDKLSKEALGKRLKRRQPSLTAVS